MRIRITLFFVLVFCSTFVVAQKTYFLYLQSETGQSFFVKHNNSIINSTSSGYLIIPELLDTSYIFDIGIQGKESNKQFLISMNKKDHGFLIMSDQKMDLTLFNLQSLVLVNPYLQATYVANGEIKVEKVESNSFNNMLAKAVDDSTIKERTTFIKKEEKKNEPVVIQKVNKDSLSLKEPVIVEKSYSQDIETKKPELVDSVIFNKKTITEEEKSINEIAVSKLIEKENQQNKEIDFQKTVEKPVLSTTDELLQDKFLKSKVSYRSESSTTEGVGLVYTDSYQNGITDTISILIPNKEEKTENVNKEIAKVENLKFLDIISDNSKVNSKTISEETVVSPNKENLKVKIAKSPAQEKLSEKKEDSNGTIKSICNSFASEADFFELRKKMAGVNEEDAMLTLGKESFEQKCYTTEQIKNLGSLFLSDLGRFQFYNSSFKYVSDKENFASLESELKDQYFIDRFKSILNK